MLTEQIEIFNGCWVIENVVKCNIKESKNTNQEFSSKWDEIFLEVFSSFSVLDKYIVQNVDHYVNNL